jgi:hypothetical protein
MANAQEQAGAGANVVEKALPDTKDPSEHAIAFDWTSWKKDNFSPRLSWAESGYG